MDTAPISFRPLQSDVTVEALFATPAFEVLEKTDALAKLLIERLGPWGLRMSDMRYDRGASFADATLTCYLNNLAWTSRIRPDRADLYCMDVAASDRPKLKATTIDLFAAIAHHTPSTSFNAYAMVVNLHGPLEYDIDRFLARFTQNAPMLGPLYSSGVAFYFSQRPEDGVLSSSITLDRSRAIPDGLFLQVNAMWDAHAFELAALPAVAELFFEGALSALGLETPKESS